MKEADQIKYGDISGRIVGIGLAVAAGAYTLYSIAMLVLHRG